MQRFQNCSNKLTALEEISSYSKEQAFKLAFDLGLRTEGQTRDVLISLCKRYVSDHWDDRHTPVEPDEFNKTIVGVVELLVNELDEETLDKIRHASLKASHIPISFQRLVADTLHHQLWLRTIR